MNQVVSIKHRGLLALAGALLVSACAPSRPPGIVPPSMSLFRVADPSMDQGTPAPTPGLRIEEVPRAPVIPVKPESAPAPGVPATAATGEVATLNLEQVTIGTFAQLVYNEILKRNVSVDPKVLARRDLVTFRTAQAQTAEQVERAVRQLLKSYGVSVVDYGGVIRVLPDDASGAMLPEVRRGAALPETPLPLRPVYHLVDIVALRPGEVAGTMRTIFGDRIKIQEDPTRNAVLLSGNADTVQAALEAIRVLDQPPMAGRSSVALYPSYWSAEEFARRLADVLSAEGYAVQPVGQTAAAGGRYPVILLPLASLNAVLVFTNSDTTTRHVSDWAVKLDRPNERGIGRNFFTYAVKHKDASVLAQTLEQLMGGAAARTANATAGGTAAAGAPARSSSVVVDKGENTLIFQASAEEYSQITSLLQRLDRPSRSALIEVTVAELTVDNSSQLGIEWLFNQSLAGGATAVGNTLGGLPTGTAGFNFRVLGSAGGVKLLLNALASDNKATILSSPRVTARNGETATIQVGQEVPIVTSQQSTNTANAVGTTGVLQTIQYRSTGVILRVKPVIHSGDQIDLDVSQEVSAAQSTSTGVNNSPTFSTRKVDTKLTLTNGATVMLGGLISDDSSLGDAGVPFLKDLPVVGNAFKSENRTTRKRELIVLITPYVLNDQRDAQTLTEAFRNMLGDWARPSDGAARPLVQPLNSVPDPAGPKRP
jgi:general secretion pathway protein D